MEKHQYIYLLSVLLLLSMPLYVILTATVFTNAYRSMYFWYLYFFVALPIGIVLLVTSCIMAIRKKKQNVAA